MSPSEYPSRVLVFPPDMSTLTWDVLVVIPALHCEPPPGSDPPHKYTAHGPHQISYPFMVQSPPPCPPHRHVGGLVSNERSTREVCMVRPLPLNTLEDHN